MPPFCGERGRRGSGPQDMPIERAAFLSSWRYFLSGPVAADTGRFAGRCLLPIRYRISVDSGCAVRFLIVSVAVILSAELGLGQTISFCPGGVAPPLAIEPANPTIANPISFTAPLDGLVYDNQCCAAVVLGGDPLLFIDDSAHQISIGFDGNVPEACLAIYDPCAGACGSFGSLPAGDWV